LDNIKDKKYFLLNLKLRECLFKKIKHEITGSPNKPLLQEVAANALSLVHINGSLHTDNKNGKIRLLTM